MLTLLIAIAASFFVATLGFREARNFTRRRLRFVDAVQSPLAPIVAGLGAALLGALVVAFIPIVGIGTALSFGIAVGMGVSSGAKDAKNGYYLAD
jgi:hypothetical protein